MNTSKEFIHAPEKNLKCNPFDALENLLHKNLIIPKHMNEKSLAEIIAICIMKKAHLTESAWGKWILLAALEELLGRSAPNLDAKSIKSLQGSLIVSADKNSSEDYKNLHSENIGNSDYSRTNQTANKPLKSTHEATENKPSASVKYRDELSKETKITLNTNTSDTGVQCSPYIMGLMRKKSSQTQGNDDTKVDISTQTEPSIYVDRPQIETKNVSSQTRVINKVNKYVQYSYKPPYRLTKVSGIKHNIKRRSSRKRCSFDSKGNVIHTFYGRPLLRANSKIETPIIPLQPLEFLPGFKAVSDPRKTSHSDSGNEDFLFNTSMDVERRGDTSSSIASEKENTSSDVWETEMDFIEECL